MPPNNAPHNALIAAVNAAIARGEPPVTEQRAVQTISMSFDPDGSIEFTRNKALDGIFGGAGRMKRVTDIQKLDREALFYIKWLMGPFAQTHAVPNNSHTADRHTVVFGQRKPSVFVKIDDNTGTLFFRSYEDAVKYEIECLNAMREAGITFDENKSAESL